MFWLSRNVRHSYPWLPFVPEVVDVRAAGPGLHRRPQRPRPPALTTVTWSNSQVLDGELVPAVRDLGTYAHERLGLNALALASVMRRVRGRPGR